MNDRSRLLLGKSPKTEVPKENEKLLGKVRKELGISKEEFLHDETVRSFVMREYHARRNASVRKSRNDIGELPAVVDPARRERCRLDFLAFLEEYCKTEDKFDKPFSKMHLDVISSIQRTVLEGGQLAMALPRGTGKSSLLERAILWSLLYAHRKFVVAIGDGKVAAQEILETVMTELECNDRLFDDFPETCLPVRKLEGIALRGNLMTYHGRNINLHFGGGGKLVLPTIEGSPSSGSILVSCGINSRLRGMKSTTSDGQELRPDMVFLDDFINDRSAASPSQNEKRLQVIHGSVMGLAGPGKKISAFMTGTVIQRGDAVDTLLDRNQNPSWNGVRYGILDGMPKNLELWQSYREILERSQRSGKGIEEATAFYKAHREALDEGCSATWESRFNADEASAIQHAMNLYFRNAEAFFAEYMNQPKGTEESQGERNLKEQDVYLKVDGLRRGVCPMETERVCVGTDVQLGLLVWVALAGCSDGTVAVIDYGTWPRQRTPNYWTLQSLSASWSNGGQLEGELYAALTAFRRDLDSLQWVREDGSPMRASRVLIDANWGKSTQTVLRWCRENGDGIWMPSFGRGITAASKPFSEYRRQAGMTIGPFWLRTRHPKTLQQVMEIDANSAKSLVKSKILSPVGTPGSMNLFGKVENASAHKGFAQQVCGEYSVLTSGRYREVEVWNLRPGSENHYLDCLGYGLAALSEQGVDFSGISGDKPEKSKKKVVRLPRKSFS